ncbi:MAG: hypothetical protein LBD06_07545 [Candidatus Accumulibacter sp.]|nr:hypothetical protein [Accumulibacter sp.]
MRRQKTGNSEDRNLRRQKTGNSEDRNLRRQKTGKHAALRAGWKGKPERPVFPSSPGAKRPSSSVFCLLKLLSSAPCPLNGAKRRKLICLLSSQTAVL